MTEQEEQNQKKTSRKRSIFFRKQRQDEVQITGFRVGDLVSEKPLMISAGAAIAGNVSAPSIRTEGTIFGSVTASSVQLAGLGQIWGDVFASEILIEAGSKLHGWVSTFDAGTLELIQSGVLSAKDVVAINIEALADDHSDEKIRARLLQKYGEGSGSDEIFHRFTMELGSNLLARKELEAMLGVHLSANGSTVPMEGQAADIMDDSLMESSEDQLHSFDALQKELVQKEADVARLEKALEEADQKIDSLFIGDQNYPWQDAERYRRTIEERDLYKQRFQKLAYWLYQNSSSLSRPDPVESD